MKHIGFCIAALVASTTQSHADDVQAAMQSFLETNISTWANDPVLVQAIISQNAQTAQYDQAKIDEMDRLWQAYEGIPDAEIIAGVITNPAADFLRLQVAQSGGAITEAFVMDARGLNVAAAAPTTDYWQGDEAKFTETYPLGAAAVHLGDVELDASTQEVQGQVSVTVVDQQTGEPVGALTVGINLTSLM